MSEINLELISSIPFLLLTAVGTIKPRLLQFGDYTPSRMLILVAGPFLSLAAPTSVAMVKGAMKKSAAPSSIVSYKEVGPKMWKELSMQCEMHVGAKAWTILKFTSGTQNSVFLMGDVRDASPGSVFSFDTYRRTNVNKTYIEKRAIQLAATLEFTSIWTKWRVESKDKNCIQVLEEIRYPTEDEILKFKEHQLSLMKHSGP